MTLAKRLDAVEDNLTPQEAVIRWMREAHEFGSCESYGRWLIDQPDDAYPLIRMPAAGGGGGAGPKQGGAGRQAADQFYRVQKDVLFLYFLHKQVEMRALMDHEAIQLRVVILIKEIRALINEKHALDQMRLDRVDLGRQAAPEAGQGGEEDESPLRGPRRSWRPRRRRWLVRILGFLAAAHDLPPLLRRRGHPLSSHPGEPRLDLETIANLREIYDDSILSALPRPMMSSGTTCSPWSRPMRPHKNQAAASSRPEGPARRLRRGQGHRRAVGAHGQVGDPGEAGRAPGGRSARRRAGPADAGKLASRVRGGIARGDSGPEGRSVSPPRRRSRGSRRGAEPPPHQRSGRWRRPG